MIWNLLDGVDIYQITDRPIWLCKLRVNVRENYPKQVDFGRRGELAVCGSDKGEVYAWDIASGIQFQVLVHGSGESHSRTTTDIFLTTIHFRGPNHSNSFGRTYCDYSCAQLNIPSP